METIVHAFLPELAQLGDKEATDALQEASFLDLICSVTCEDWKNGVQARGNTQRQGDGAGYSSVRHLCGLQLSGLRESWRALRPTARSNARNPVRDPLQFL